MSWLEDLPLEVLYSEFRSATDAFDRMDDEGERGRVRLDLARVVVETGEELQRRELLVELAREFVQGEG